MASAVSSSKLDLEVVEIENPNGLNFILGHSHFIKTVEDLAEVMAQAGGGAKWGLAFCEASGDPDNADMPGTQVVFGTLSVEGGIQEREQACVSKYKTQTKRLAALPRPPPPPSQAARCASTATTTRSRSSPSA